MLPVFFTLEVVQWRVATEGFKGNCELHAIQSSTQIMPHALQSLYVICGELDMKHSNCINLVLIQKVKKDNQS